MSLLDAISKFENNEVDIEEKETEEIMKIRSKVKEMEDGYFLQVARNINFLCNQFVSNKTEQNEYFVEEARLNFLMDEIRYNGYKEILENPKQVKSIKERVIAEIKQLEAQKKALLAISTGVQTRLTISKTGGKNGLCK